MRLLLVPFALFALLAAGEEAATEESSTPDEANAYYEKPEAEAEPISEQDAQAQAKAKEARKKEAEKYSYCEYDNCYDLLGVKDTSGPIPIKRAYRKLAAEWHPDKCPSGDIAKCKEVFPKYANAYEILSSSEMRKNYDFVLANPELFVGFYMKYSKPVYAPKSDLRFVFLLTILAAAGVQHLLKQSTYDQALSAMKSDPRGRYKERLNEIMARQDGKPPSPAKAKSGAARGEANSSKHNKVSVKAEELEKRKKAAEEILAEEMASELPPRPSLADNIAVDVFKSPLTITYTLLWAISGGMRDPGYKTRKALGMSAAEWDDVDEEEQSELIGKELWVGENLEAYEEGMGGGSKGPKSGKEKRAQRAAKKAKANPSSMVMED